jgi:hypothetical protein
VTIRYRSGGLVMGYRHWFMRNYTNDRCLFVQCPLKEGCGKGFSQYVALKR